MKKEDDYVAGPHHYWTHFSCGLVFGALLGLWIGTDFFESGWANLATVAVISVAMAFSCGRWGDRAWQWIIERLH
jgi:hypothetical protein